MAPFSADMLKKGDNKFSFGDSEAVKTVEDLLLFSIPTVDTEKKQEIQIIAEGYHSSSLRKF